MIQNYLGAALFQECAYTSCPEWACMAGAGTQQRVPAVHLSPTKPLVKQELPKCSCIQHVTASLSKNNHSLFHLHDPRRPLLSSPTPSLPYKGDKYSATMANVTIGSTLGALPTTCRSSQNTPRTAGRGWKRHSCTSLQYKGRMKCSVGCEEAAISPGSCCIISRHL